MKKDSQTEYARLSEIRALGRLTGKDLAEATQELAAKPGHVATLYQAASISMPGNLTTAIRSLVKMGQRFAE